MDVQIAEAVSSLIYGVAWAGMVFCYDFAMNRGNILNWWYRIIERTPNWTFKILGGCPICFGFWCSLFTGDFILIGISQLILILRYGND